MRFHLGVNLGLVWLHAHFDRHTARQPQFIGPHRHRWQCRSGVISGNKRLRQRTLEGFPDHQQLRARGLQQRGELGLNTGPVRVSQQVGRLRLPVVNVSIECLQHRLRIAP